MFNKKAQLGETLTWVVATVIIIVILLLSIFITSAMAKTKGLSRELLSLKSGDLLVIKSLSAYLLTSDDSGEKVFSQLQSNADTEDVQGVFNVFSGELAEDIFLKLYSNDYEAENIWLGVYLVGYGVRRNSYFETPNVDINLETGVYVIPEFSIGLENLQSISPFVAEEIILEDGRYFVLLFTN